MELRVKPTPDQEAFIREGIASGRFQSADDAARAALQQWEEYERQRATLLRELKDADSSTGRGNGVRADSSQALVAFFEDVKKRARSQHARRKGKS